MENIVNIEKIIHGGRGLARLENGMVVLVSNVLTGEKVQVQLHKEQRGYALARPVSILEPSPDRINPPCPWYGQCGGCDLQHMNISAQHQAKVEIVRESLQRAKVPVTQNTIRQLLPSPDQFNYRYKIRLQYSPTGAIGFYRAQSNEIVEINHCLLATKRINAALDEILQKELLSDMGPELAEVELLHSPADDKLFCLLHTRDKKTFNPLDKKIISNHDTIDVIAVSKAKNVRVLHSRDDENYLSQDFPESICEKGYSIQWTPGCFSQVNAGQNINLVKAVCQLLGQTANTRVLDLFCGTGNFSIPMALTGAVVMGVERNSESIFQAKSNAKQLELDNITFHDRDVTKWLQRATNQGHKFDTVILDPPRQGLGKSIGLLARLSPEKILYISCDPATLARDIAKLCDYGYRLEEVTPVDMFPQTHHIESIALLEKN